MSIPSYHNPHRPTVAQPQKTENEPIPNSSHFPIWKQQSLHIPSPATTPKHTETPRNTPSAIISLPPLLARERWRSAARRGAFRLPALALLPPQCEDTPII